MNDLHSFKIRARHLWRLCANLGVANAPIEHRERIRRTNVSVFMYAAFGLAYVVTFATFGLSNLAIFSLVTMSPGPVIVLLNAKAKHQAARILQTISFPFVIAAVYCSIGEQTGVELLFFPAIASIFVNFSNEERKEIRTCLIIAAALFIFALKYAHVVPPWLKLDEHILPYMRVSFWLVSFFLFVAQVSMFFGAIQRSKLELIRSHANIQGILESVDDGFYFVDRNWTLLYVNPKAQGFLTAHGVQNAIGADFWKLVPSENDRDFVGKLKSAMATGIPLRYEYYDEIQVQWMELRGDPSAAGMSVSFREITDRKNAELAVKENEALLRRIFAQAGTGLTVLDAHGRYINVNEEMARITGYSEEELRRITFPQLSFPEDHEADREHFRQLSMGEINFLAKPKHYRHKSGATVYVNIQISTLKNDQGQVKYFVTSVQDMTAVKLAEQKLLHASKMSSLGEMAGSIAHEINNPLAIIQLSAEQLEDAASGAAANPEVVSKIATRIIDTVSRVSKIIRGLKAFSRNAELDPMVGAKLKDIIDDSLELCRERFRNKGVELRIGRLPEVELVCRPTEISQVMLNLLSNAFDAVVSRDGDRWVSIDVAQESSGLVIAVTDSGTGISAQVEDRMLEPFFTTKELGQGTGLGLSISKGIMETHGGKLYFDRKSANTRFVLAFAPI